MKMSKNLNSSSRDAMLTCMMSITYIASLRDAWDYQAFVFATDITSLRDELRIGALAGINRQFKISIFK